MVSILEAVILSIVQGIAEWLPISSSGHLAIFHSIFGFQELSFDVYLHFASIIAVVVVFWKDIIKILHLKDKRNRKYIILLIIGVIPAGIFGVLFKDKIENLFSSMFYLGVFFIISGILIYSTKFAKQKNRTIDFFDSILIGIFQSIALLPGISRSGATISGGIYRGVQKEEAIKFSFLMAIPIVFGASILEFKDLVYSNINYNILLTSFLITFLASIFSIKFLLKIIKTDKFYLFGIYNFILGLIILSYKLFL